MEEQAASEDNLKETFPSNENVLNEQNVASKKKIKKRSKKADNLETDSRDFS